MNDLLSVGMVGSGTIAHSHMRAMAKVENMQLVAVMDVDEARAEAAAQEYGGRACASLEDLLDMPEVEAVHVCTPHNLHADQVVAAGRAGKHVLVEKPMALTPADCDRMIQACEEAGKVLMVGQVMRYYPVNRKVRELIASGAIGDVGHLVRRRYGYFDPVGSGSSYGAWYLDQEVGGNCVLYCFGPHEYDILPWYLNSPVVRVFAQGTESAELYAGQKDSYTAMMTHENGALSVLSQSVVCHSGAHDQFIIGSTGSIMVTNQTLVLNGEEMELEETSGAGMPNQLGEFATCCLEGGTPDASGRSVRHTMAVIEAAKQSAERNEAVEVAEFA